MRIRFPSDLDASRLMNGPQYVFLRRYRITLIASFLMFPYCMNLANLLSISLIHGLWGPFSIFDNVVDCMHSPLFRVSKSLTSEKERERENGQMSQKPNPRMWHGPQPNAGPNQAKFKYIWGYIKPNLVRRTWIYCLGIGSKPKVGKIIDWTWFTVNHG